SLRGPCNQSFSGLLSTEDQPARQQQGERGMDHQITSPEPARLLRETEEPLQSVALHPARRHFFVASVEIKRRPHAKLYASDRLLVLVGEPVLPRTTEPDEDQSGPAIINSLNRCFGFCLAELAE